MRGIYPGSFDPVTKGHIEIMKRAAGLVDELVVGILINNRKSPLFSVEERVRMLEDVTRGMNTVTIMSFDGLLVDFARNMEAKVLFRGLRAVTDFEYELQLAQTNSILAPGIETVFLATGLDYSYVSSSMVKEVAELGGDISRFVTKSVGDKVIEKISSKGEFEQ